MTRKKTRLKIYPIFPWFCTSQWKGNPGVEIFEHVPRWLGFVHVLKIISHRQLVLHGQSTAVNLILTLPLGPALWSLGCAMVSNLSPMSFFFFTALWHLQVSHLRNLSIWSGNPNHKTNLSDNSSTNICLHITEPSPSRTEDILMGWTSLIKHITAKWYFWRDGIGKASWAVKTRRKKRHHWITPPNNYAGDSPPMCSSSPRGAYMLPTHVKHLLDSLHRSWPFRTQDDKMQGRKRVLNTSVITGQASRDLSRFLLNWAILKGNCQMPHTFIWLQSSSESP